MNKRRIIEEKIEKVKRPFPSELPGTDTKIDFVTEDDRIIGEAMEYLEKGRNELIAPFDPSLKAEIANYDPKDVESKRIHDESLALIRDLDDIVSLINKEIDISAS